MEESKVNGLITDYTKFVIKTYKTLTKNIAKLRSDLEYNNDVLQHNIRDKRKKKQMLDSTCLLIYINKHVVSNEELSNRKVQYMFAKNAVVKLYKRHKDIKKELKKNLDSLSQLTNDKLC